MAFRSRARRCAQLALLVGAASTIAACSVGCGHPDARPNLLLVIVDTQRADHLGLYGYERDTSPTLDALAREGVWFERAYVPAPWTKPSIASVLTGRYPREHGLIRMRQRLPEEALTLAEILRSEGWSTAAVVSNLLIGHTFGFAQGFERFSEDEALGHGHISSPGVTRRAIGLLDALPPPFFLLVHYFDPHYAYLPHESVDFAAPSAGRLSGDESMQHLREMGLDAEELGFLKDVYDEELRFTDDAIGRLLGAVADRGLLENTIVVATADHGEEFLDRGWIGHTRTLYDELIHSPLLIRLPQRMRTPELRGRSVSQPVSLVALAPTLLELLGVPAPPGAGFAHRSLVPLMQGHAEDPEPVYAEVDFLASEENAPEDVRMRAIVDGRHKLIDDELKQRIELYDLEADPGERRNLASQQVDLARRLGRELDQGLGGPGPRPRYAPEVQFSPEFMRDLSSKLKALGYVNEDP